MTQTIINPATIDEPYLHVVAAIIWHPRGDSRFLIARRQKGKHLEDFWELPGGKLENGESRWQGLCRELSEEIGIEAVQGRPYMQVYHRYPERNVLLDTWVVNEFHGEVSPQEDQLVTWVGVTSLDLFRFPPADLPILEAITRTAKAGTRHHG